MKEPGQAADKAPTRGEGEPVLYFAYGSNMSRQRLEARVGPVRRLGRARLPDHRLAFHKISTRDGSGKADIVPAGGCEVWGVLFELPAATIPVLDRIEERNRGYEAVWVEVQPDSRAAPRRALSYLALQTDPRLRPYDWYLRHLLEGAREGGLPTAYCRMLAGLSAHADADLARADRELSLYRRS